MNNHTIYIDFGNTSTKLLLDNEDFYSFPSDSSLFENIVDIINKYNVNKGLYASVIFLNADLILFLQEHNVFSLKKANLNLPFSLEYESIDTLGEDRIAAAVGAYSLNNDETFLTIQIGTAITYDYVINKKYLGGAISPGFAIRYLSLHNFTQKLPLLKIENENFNIDMVGKNTIESIHSGVYWGVLHEIQARIDDFINKFQSPVYISTSFKQYLDKKLKNCNFANQNLALLGLKFLLK
ncbi:MAG: type III pantothenate kinase [Bacteroidales bacterium]|nr:type III pantothenate kinase [Bacteroidales bacterium]